MKILRSILFLKILGSLCLTSFAENQDGKAFHAEVIFEDGKALIHVKVPLDADPGVYVEFEGVASSRNGVSMAASKAEELKLKEIIIQRLKKMELSEFMNRSIKKDMKLVFEEDLREVIAVSQEIQIGITKLIISSGNQNK